MNLTYTPSNLSFLKRKFNMRIRKFNESKDSELLLYYAFDWDDNLLFMTTKIIVLNDKGEEVGISTEEFAEYRGKIGKEDFTLNGETIVGFPTDDKGSIDPSFRNFRDENDPLIFKKDTIESVESGKFGPAWEDFIECLIHGSLFTIITARGHEDEAIRGGIEWILDEYLSDEQKQEMYNHLLMYKYHAGEETNHPRIVEGQFSKNEVVSNYLDLCGYVGVASPSRGGTPANPEKAKREELIKFKDKVNKLAHNLGKKAAIGFSDDDPGNVDNIQGLFDEISHERFPNIVKYVVKDTHGGGVKSSTRVMTFESFKKTHK
jgi:hypothetical protein